MLYEFYGSILPLPVNQEARAKTHDPRKSIAERYTGLEDHRQRVTNAADELARERFALPQDRDYVGGAPLAYGRR
jgi:hypothetical protein